MVALSGAVGQPGRHRRHEQRPPWPLSRPVRGRVPGQGLSRPTDANRDTRPAGPNAAAGRRRASGLLGTWHSPKPADQPTSAKTYYVELTIRAGAVDTRVGDVRYPGLDCSGSLTLVQAAPERLVVAEHIDKLPKDPCTIDGFITLTPTATGLHLEYVRRDEPNSVTMRAELIH